MKKGLILALGMALLLCGCSQAMEDASISTNNAYSSSDKNLTTQGECTDYQA